MRTGRSTWTVSELFGETLNPSGGYPIAIVCAEAPPTRHVTRAASGAK